MPCTNPIKAWRARYLTKNGKRPLVFSAHQGYSDLEVTVPCGRCTDCRLDYSRMWATRCMHEAQLHRQNCFITLTYDNEHIPADTSIRKEELRLFWKRWRKQLKKSVRYFACGEYGEQSGRPHYHAIIFGYDFADKLPYSQNQDGTYLYMSEQLQKLWGKGFTTVGEVTFQSAAYVARYAMKKRKGKPDTVDPKTGKTNAEYYQRIDKETGEVINIQPEFCVMSLKPGIGADWLKQYKSDTNKDFITVERSRQRLPKYYDTLLERMGEDMIQRKAQRRANIDENERTLERLDSKAKCTEARANQLKRTI